MSIFFFMSQPSAQTSVSSTNSVDQSTTSSVEQNGSSGLQTQSTSESEQQQQGSIVASASGNDDVLAVAGPSGLSSNNNNSTSNINTYSRQRNSNSASSSSAGVGGGVVVDAAESTLPRRVNPLRMSYSDRQNLLRKTKTEMFAPAKLREVFADFSDGEAQNALRMMDILFRNRFLNEYYRMRTFMHAPSKIHESSHEKNFVTAGLYYSGQCDVSVLRSLTRCNERKLIECHYISCVFCGFEGVITCEDMDDQAKYDAAVERIVQTHMFETNRDVNCSEKRGNKLLRDNLSPFNLHMSYSANLYPMTNLEPVSKKIVLTRSEVENRDNVRTVCQMCRQRIIDVALLPCGCIFMCGVCCSQYTVETCMQCGKSIVGYGRAILL